MTNDDTFPRHVNPIMTAIINCLYLSFVHFLLNTKRREMHQKLDAGLENGIAQRASSSIIKAVRTPVLKKKAPASLVRARRV